MSPYPRKPLNETLQAGDIWPPAISTISAAPLEMRHVGHIRHGLLAAEIEDKKMEPENYHKKVQKLVDQT